MNRKQRQPQGGLTSRSVNLPPRSANLANKTSTVTKPSASPPASATSRSNRKSDPASNEKVSDSKLEYENALAQLQLIQQKLRQQTLTACHLEREALEFYYSHVICFEGYSGEPMPQQQSSSHHYYFNSTIARARQTDRERRATEEQQLQRERCRVEHLEEELRSSVVMKRLEGERCAVRSAEAEKEALERQLAQKHAERNSREEELQKQREKLQQMRREFLEREAEIRQLEIGKRKQMEDMETIRLQLKTQRGELDSAQTELQRREKVVEDLQQTIERLSRKK
ncbi:hypothetical protein, conserved [Trypanosoma brucei gambiense DAL972]|uniref:Uncharacterized protein n=1 Tax=Trypanosoma brucei gambiense (strain MHOM/CI/86/DAL972) TaxID=679716 RepID=C9ZMT1_TRYB9|nr:hypothetical protein, conserved [Trypanosoma brucei gambiense DAL972]CBH10584.1 hypothetical protein, conserved [Trypanosoma brucei gambiense DAL972]|eukprot:XP_011772873.1 hypothetical protein, conserved [Trypanosoma brucei gambiense DAL972]